jgi:hypothetical protein
MASHAETIRNFYSAVAAGDTETARTLWRRESNGSIFSLGISMARTSWSCMLNASEARRTFFVSLSICRLSAAICQAFSTDDNRANHSLSRPKGGSLPTELSIHDSVQRADCDPPKSARWGV